MALLLYNSIEREKQLFVPLTEGKVGMYVCGPTVYDRPHVGNARAVVVYDVLYRLLCHEYGESNVNFVRNITDVDDKINAQSQVSGEPISAITERVTQWFHDDMAALNNVLPTQEPKATEHMQDIIDMVAEIIENGHAYVSEGHVLFDVKNAGDFVDYFYGKLSGKKQEDLIAGARVEVESYKKNSSDFVLWKPSNDEEPGWESSWGRGRPGWHIECSAMSTRYLGENFDIHGGGADLKFPHHENEIVQSLCAHKGSHYAKYWVHNGFVTVDGEKMSKSLGNFFTVKDMLEKGIAGEVIRYVLLATHYRKPLDFAEKSIEDAKKNLDMFYGAIRTAEENIKNDALLEVNEQIVERSAVAYENYIAALEDDMNTPKALAELYVMAKGIRSLHATPELLVQFKDAAKLMGLLYSDVAEWFDTADVDEDEQAKIEQLIECRMQAKAQKKWAQADEIRDELVAMGIVLKDSPEGTTWTKEG